MTSELRRPTNPNCANYENNLRQDQIEQAEFFFESRTTSFDLVLDRGKICLR